MEEEDIPPDIGPTRASTTPTTTAAAGPSTGLPAPLASLLASCSPAEEHPAEEKKCLFEGHHVAARHLVPATPSSRAEAGPGNGSTPGNSAREKSGSAPETRHGAGPQCQGNLRQSSQRNGLLQGHSTASTGKRQGPKPTADHPTKTRRTSTGSAPTAMETDVETKTRIPPIILDLPKSWASHAIAIGQLVAGDMAAVCNARKLRIKTSTVAHFRAIQRYLQEQKMAFHTFALKTEKMLKVVVRGVPTTLTPADLVDELQGSGFSCTEAKILKTRGGKPTGLWLFTLQGIEGARPPSEIFDLQSMMYCRIQVRKYTRPSGPIQCHKCQGFGHGSSHCHRDTCCVRCGGPHPGSLCSKEPTAPARCCNCGGAHSANYRGCTAFKSEKRLSYAAAAAAKTPGQEVKRQAPQPPSAAEPQEEEPETVVDAEGFQTVKGRRRRRNPRNPANRGQRSSPESQATRTEDEATLSSDAGVRPKASPAPSPRPRTTPRLRLEMPKPPRGNPPTACGDAPEATSTSGSSAQSSKQFDQISEILSQLHSMLSLVAKLVEKLTTDTRHD